MTQLTQHRIFPISDSALTIDFGNIINESLNLKVLSLFHGLQKKPLTGMVEAVPAYSSLTVYYDLFQLRRSVPPDKTVYEWMCIQVEERLRQPFEAENRESRLVEIPVCYEKEFAPDIEELAQKKNISTQEVISIHGSKQYRVYMIGFLPGFSYMGEVDEKISVSRKSQPVMVAAGSIGIAGKQTGIYPLSSPGGWRIIGRTPLKLFDAEKKESTLLKAGDAVKFISISKNEFESY